MIREVRPSADVLPILAGVFVVYLVIGGAMPVLPLHVHDRLGFGTFAVGMVAGSQFAASLMSRFWAGHVADRRGGKRAMAAGLIAAGAAGFLYLLSLLLLGWPPASVAVLLLGRAVLGGAESFIVSGALIWGMTLAGPQNTGKLMSWVGIAMYAAYAAGAPLGTALYARFGFIAIALATMLIPLATLGLVARLSAPRPEPKPQPPLRQVLGAIWAPGLGLAFSSIGFGAITTFVVLYFAANGWAQGWLALTLVSVSFAGARILFGHTPDRIGGAKIAFICILIEAAGQALIWLAASPVLAFAGASLTGAGYALAYPGFGVEAVRRTAPEHRGIVTGAYAACLDLTLGLGNPALGWIAGLYGLRAVYLVSTVIVLSAAVIALQTARAGSASE